MWVRSSLFLLVSVVFAQVNIQKPPTADPTKLPEVDVREVERRNVERKYGNVRVPEITPPTPLPPPQEEPPPPPPPMQPAINLRDMRGKLKPFEIRYGEDLRQQEEKNKNATVQSTAGAGGSCPQANALAKLAEEQFQRTITFSGYCRLLDDLEISLEPQQGRVECLVNRKIYRGYMLFVPEVEQYALRAKLVELGGRRIENSEVWTADRRSQNVAWYVDRRIISNILLATTRQTGKEVTDIAKEAIKPERPTVTFPSGASLTLSQPGVKEEALRNLHKYAFYLGLANLIGTTAEELLAGRQRIPPLFKVKKGQEFYFVAEISVENKMNGGGR